MALQLFEIADVTVSSPQASISFTSIPQGYTDLVLVSSARRTAIYADSFIRFNSDSGANYSYKWLRSDGSGASSSSLSAQTYLQAGHFASRSTYSVNAFGNGSVYIPNYTSAKQKSVSVDSLNENNGTQAETMMVAGLWTGTAAINSITVYPDIGYGDYAANSTFTLYGVL
jgi:hypothetical protein